MPLQAEMQAYTIRISRRAKYARITIKPNLCVEVVLPLGVAKREAGELFKQQQPWIKRTLLRMQQHAPKALGSKLSETLPENLPEKIELRALGESVLIAYHESPRAGFSELDGVLSIRLNPEQDKANQVARVLHAWLKVRARESLPDCLQAVALEMNAAYQAVSIRLQKTRWGSCSSLGNINLNAKLLLLPPEVVRYVLVHELAHLKHMNHSPLFWHHVAQFEPEFARKRKELQILSMGFPVWVHA
ncbi:MAG: SprT family zinc-dependent metalloprotease [Mariprofundaceae bacterium]|nr:SprT family zinc-dependent metalloprotease [Mariprofundaceae bacterium]